MSRLLSFLLLLLIAPNCVAADDGVFDNKIIFGQTAIMKGAAAALGLGMRNGILAAFKESNDTGGISGRTLELISHDDGYEPSQAIINTHTLLNEDKVFALIGSVGTPTANAILPIITKAKVPLIGPFTGAQLLRTPFNRYAVNIRASYMQEAEAWIEHLTKDLGIKRIAIFYQEDTYGLAGLAGVQKALKKREMELIAQGTYRRNTLAVKKAVITIMRSKPEAIVMIGTYKPSAKFIQLSKKLGVKARFINISFVGSEALAHELHESSEGVIVSQVVPFPFDTKNHLVKAYQTAMKSYDPESSFGFVSMEGYIVGRLTIDVLKKINGPITREAFLDTLYKTGIFSLDGTKLSYSNKNNQGMNKVFLTVLNDQGRFIPQTKLEQ